MISVPFAFSQFRWRREPGPQSKAPPLKGRRFPGSLLCLMALCLLVSACETTKERQAEPSGTESAANQAAVEQPPAIPPGVPPSYDPDLAQISLFSGMRVGLLLPLSGAYKEVGEALLNAAQLALFDIADDKFELLIGDTAGTPEGARDAARGLLDQGARLLLGPLFGSSVSSVAQEARLRQVPVITFSNNLSVAAPGTYVMGISPQSQVERIVSFAVSQQLFRFAALAPENAYGDAALAAMQSAVFQSGAELVDMATYDPSGANMTDVVRRLADYDRRQLELEKERERLESLDDAASKLALEHLENRDTLNPPDYDAVLIAAGGRELLTVAPLLAYYDVDSLEVRYLGTALWEDENLGIEPTMQGGWFSAPPNALWDDFQARYQRTFAAVPPRVASLGYDATALAAILARQAKDPMAAGVFSDGALTDPNGFAGIDGIFRFLPEGPVQRVLTVYEVGRDGFRVLEPAPSSFEYMMNDNSLIN